MKKLDIKHQFARTLVCRLMASRLIIFRARSILLEFVVPKLMLLFTAEGWSAQPNSIYYGCTKVASAACQCDKLIKPDSLKIVEFLAKDISSFAFQYLNVVSWHLTATA